MKDHYLFVKWTGNTKLDIIYVLIKRGTYDECMNEANDKYSNKDYIITKLVREHMEG